MSIFKALKTKNLLAHKYVCHFTILECLGNSTGKLTYLWATRFLDYKILIQVDIRRRIRKK